MLLVAKIPVPDIKTCSSLFGRSVVKIQVRIIHQQSLEFCCLKPTIATTFKSNHKTNRLFKGLRKLATTPVHIKISICISVSQKSVETIYNDSEKYRSPKLNNSLIAVKIDSSKFSRYF